MIRLDLRDRRWTEFVASCPHALAFHEPAWSEVVAECYGYRRLALGVTDGSGCLEEGVPLVEVGGRRRPRRWVSLPFTDYCPPLSSSGASPVRLPALLDAARREARVSRLELKADLAGAGASTSASGVRHTLELARDPDEVLAFLKRSQAARNIARARREGVVVRRGETLGDLSRVYYDLHARTRRRLGAPAQPRRFFELLWRRMLEPGLGFLLLAFAGERPIAGAVFLTGGRTMTYKFGASEAGSWSLRPNHLLFWTAIVRGCEEGFRELDFGRTELHHRGLLEFKRQWATSETPLVYAALGEPPKRRRGGRLQRAKGTIIRRGPLSVARAWGALFYKHAA